MPDWPAVCEECERAKEGQPSEGNYVQNLYYKIIKVVVIWIATLLLVIQITSWEVIWIAKAI